jgi:hypothetical protein
MRWENAKILDATVKSMIGGVCKVKAGKNILRVTSGKENIRFQTGNNGIVTFDTKAGNLYQLTF